jgi:hypothetical protein
MREDLLTAFKKIVLITKRRAVKAGNIINLIDLRRCMVDYDYSEIPEERVKEVSKPFEFTEDERNSLHEIKKALKGKCSYEQLTEFREYLEGIIERVHTALLNAREMNYDTTDIELDLQFLRDLEKEVIKRQHEEM